MPNPALRALPRLALALLAVSSGCPPESDTYEGFTNYLIQAGEHYCEGTGAAIVTSSAMPFQTIFDDTAVYTTVDPTNQGDINKLWGFSDCTSFHHENSARFGWRWYGSELQIHAYTYVDGVRDSELMGVVGFEEPHDYSIELAGPEYVFTLDDTVVFMPRGCDGSGGIRYQLYPYFGGDETAPHDVNVWIKEL